MEVALDDVSQLQPDERQKVVRARAAVPVTTPDLSDSIPA